MLKEKNPLLKIKFENKNTSFFINIFEALYAFYDFILIYPIESFWFECFDIILSYLHIIEFAFDKTVSKL